FMTPRSPALFGLLVTFAFTFPLRAADKVDNPQYASWAKHQVGTSVTMKIEVETGPMTVNQQMVQTLKEITPEKAVIESVVKTEMAGQTDERKVSRDIPAKVEPDRIDVPADMKNGTAKTVGKETVEIAGHSYDCRIVEFSGDGQQGKASGKSWRSEDIPGGLAKSDMVVEAQMKMNIGLVTTAVDLK
ncbi:MAG: hypothetical protein ACREJC_09070, partial [Tepidisphaeraceae bacterium]